MPKSIYPESYASSNSGNLNKLLKLKLREHALILRRLASSLSSSSSEDSLRTVRAKKEELMGEVWEIMTATLGVPPLPGASFTWDYNDKDDKPHTWTGTPVEFYKKFTSKQYPVSCDYSCISR